MTDVNPEAPAFPAEWIATARWLASRFLNGKVCSTFTTLEKDFLDHAFRDESSDLNSMLSYFQHRGLIGAEKPHFVGTETEARLTDYAREILPAILDFVQESVVPDDSLKTLPGRKLRLKDGCSPDEETLVFLRALINAAKNPSFNRTAFCKAYADEDAKAAKRLREYSYRFLE